MSRCKCPKADARETGNCPPYFENITSKMEERRCDLLGRQRYLREKVTTMERSIPALMAYNMWMSKEKCDDPPYCKVREIMKKFSPHPDQTEKLLDNLKRTVKELNGETVELHEKIIDADVKLEETGMKLESLELANKEMNVTLTSLEKEVKSYTSPSLHSIRSEDLLCLSKIRQLAKEELNLKNYIKELEQKETLFKEHMDRLLTSGEYQSACGRRKVASCVPNVECDGGRISCVPRKCPWRKSGSHRAKKKPEREEPDVSDAIVSTSEQSIKTKQDREVQPDRSDEKVEKRSSWIPNWFKNNSKTDQAPSQTKNEETSATTVESNGAEKTIPTPVNSKESPSPETESKERKPAVQKPSKSGKNGFTTPSCRPCGHAACPPESPTKSAQYSRSCVPRNRRPAAKKLCAGKFVAPCNVPCGSPFGPSRKPFYDLPRCVTTDHGIRQVCKPFVSPCHRGSPCEICPSPCSEFLPLRSKGNCRCNCRGKCARGLSEAACNCSDAPLDPSDEYQPTASKLMKDPREESNSEDEFCECCSCGCEDSDASLSCQCV